MNLAPFDEADRQLRACLAAYPAIPAQNVDPSAPGFWERARAHGVALLVAKQLRATSSPPAPGQPSSDDPARDMVRAQAIAGIRVLSVLRTVLDALRQANVPAVSLKGPVLGARLYADYSWRPTSDVDVLISPSRCDQAIAALERVGGAVDEGYRERRQLYHRRFGYHLGVTLRGVLVELHFRPTTRFGAQLDSDLLIARSAPIRILDLDTRVLEPVDEMVYLATHAAAHAFSRDVLLLDLRMLAGSTSIDWLTLQERASAARVRRAVGSALAMAGHRVGMDLQPMPVAWRLSSERSLRLWPEGIGSDVPSTRWESVVNLLADAAWSDSPGIAATYAASRLGYSAATVVAERLGRLIGRA